MRSMPSRRHFPVVHLVYEPECPNVEGTRTNLLLAFAKAGITPSWSEHRIGDVDAPETVRGYGSPTILVDGRDIAGVAPGEEVCCRIYAEPPKSSNSGTPSVELIARALAESAKRV
jgi:hypothetical protein